MYLKPSEIFYSQDSINNVFDKNCAHSYQLIGETLDAICDGRCSIQSIPTISVVKHDNKWFTADNRRLWVFRNLERLGTCSEIYVTEGYYIPSSKFTTYNGGVDVIVRNGSPGGYWYKKSEFGEIPAYGTESNWKNTHDHIYDPMKGLRFRESYNFNDPFKSLNRSNDTTATISHTFSVLNDNYNDRYTSTERGFESQKYRYVQIEGSSSCDTWERYRNVLVVLVSLAVFVALFWIFVKFY